MKHHHGIALPLFSLRNPLGSGVGEFFDLIPIIKWVKACGFDILQLLPLNDSGFDSSPYMALSAHALHPLYLSLHKLPFVEEMPGFEGWMDILRSCNSLERFNYNLVLTNKTLFLRDYFDALFPKMEALDTYQQFINKEAWLDDYASFKCLLEANEYTAWWDWKTDELIDTKAKDFHKMCQFLAFSQWQEVRNAAKEAGILLMGDIPILINKNSVDVWAHQNLFDLQYAAGAPPDMYSEEGQYWGFPLYKWQSHFETDFAWWKGRLQCAEKLYDLYRIDHIVGFFRIWAIPLYERAINGFYIPHNEAESLLQGKKILRKFLESTTMRPIGEDLGVIPDSVRALMKELHIPGTKVYRWERRWNGDKSYVPISEYPQQSMTTVSTHDSTTLKEWWQTATEEVRAFCAYKGWDYESELSYKKQLEILRDSHQSASIYHINLLQEYLSLLSELSWDTSEEDRINIPGIVSDFNWTYRFKPIIEEITSNKTLKDTLKYLSNP